jgi:predicted kinase
MSLIVLLGGLPFSGRTTLARRLEQRYGLYYYNMRKNWPRNIQLGRRGVIKHILPRTDREYVRVYENALKEIAALAHTHQNIVVSDSFHRRTPREFFFQGVKKYFDNAVFVWVDATVPSVAGLVENKIQNSEIKSDVEAEQRLVRVSSELEPPESGVPRYIFDAEQRKLVKLWRIIQKNILGAT